MCYTGINKRFQALAVLVGASNSGVADAFSKELKHGQPDIHNWMLRKLPLMSSKAHRWSHEMHEIAAFLERPDGAARMFEGAGALYNLVAEELQVRSHQEVLSALNDYLDS